MMSKTVAAQSRNRFMPVLISMLRGVNVGPHHRIKMDALRALYENLKLENPRTYVQSGNVIFRTREKNAAKLGKQIQDAIDAKLGPVQAFQNRQATDVAMQKYETTVSDLCTSRSTKVTTQAAFGKSSPHSVKLLFVLTIVELF